MSFQKKQQEDFIKHDICYKNYTSEVNNEKKKKNGSIETMDEWALVRKAIDETVIQNETCLSLDALMELKSIQKQSTTPQH